VTDLATPLLAVLVVLLLLVLYAVLIYNGLQRLRNDVRKAWSNIDVLLQQRASEVPNLVATVRGYTQHEEKVLAEVAQARAALLQASGVRAKGEASAQLTASLRSLFAVAEGYPQLQASANYLALQQRLSALEDSIADRREFYNDSVAAYNTRIASFPDMLVARRAGMAQPQPLFQAEEAARAAVRVDLSPR
jgi:LemA protein